MLKLAKPYEEELNKLWYDTWLVPKYKYVHGSYFNPITVSDDCSEHEQHACIREVDGQQEVIGYIDLCYYRLLNTVSINVAVNFTDDLLFAKNLVELFHSLFRRGTRKVIWCALANNPVIKSYTRLCTKFGGKIEGILREDCLTWDREFEDTIMFGVLKSDYEASKVCRL